MGRTIRIAALVAAFGSSLGLAATLAAGQPAGAGPVWPPDITHGQRICIGQDIDTDDIVEDVHIHISGDVCVPLLPDGIQVDIARDTP